MSGNGAGWPPSIVRYKGRRGCLPRMPSRNPTKILLCIAVHCSGAPSCAAHNRFRLAARAPVRSGLVTIFRPSIFTPGGSSVRALHVLVAGHPLRCKSPPQPLPLPLRMQPAPALRPNRNSKRPLQNLIGAGAAEPLTAPNVLSPKRDEHAHAPLRRVRPALLDPAG